MPVKHFHSFLVHPAKNAEKQPDIIGRQIGNEGVLKPLRDMLSGVFDRSGEECNIEIVARPDGAGKRQNDCRDLLIAYTTRPTIETGRQIAARLQSFTTNRSGLGLLFLMVGDGIAKRQLVISRFAADQGVTAEEDTHGRLSVQFHDRIYMKHATSYKSALYADDVPSRGFWEGRAVDKQITGPRESSDYWIREFLASELRTTGPQGTRRLASALRSAISDADELALRHQLVSAAVLMANHDGRSQSTRQLLQQLRLSDPAVQAIEKAFPRAELLDETFQFDAEEFQRQAVFRTVELDNGAIMTAAIGKFDNIFQKTTLNEPSGRMRYVTEGRVVEETLRKKK